jgi:hypothetical protein
MAVLMAGDTKMNKRIVKYMRYYRARNKLFELLIFIPYIGSVCPICNSEIESIQQFKRAKFGHGPDIIHAECWNDYIAQYPENTPRIPMYDDYEQ